MSQAVHDSLSTPLGWKPYVKPVDMDKATPEQLDALKIIRRTGRFLTMYWCLPTSPKH